MQRHGWTGLTFRATLVALPPGHATKWHGCWTNLITMLLGGVCLSAPLAPRGELFYLPRICEVLMIRALFGEVAQSVEQGSHKPRVDGSIPSLATHSCATSMTNGGSSGLLPRLLCRAQLVDFSSDHGNVEACKGSGECRVPFGDRLRAGQWSLEPFMKVRILLPEPLSSPLELEALV